MRGAHRAVITDPAVIARILAHRARAVGTHPTARGARRCDGDAHPLRPLPLTCSPGPLGAGTVRVPGGPEGGGALPCTSLVGTVTDPLRSPSDAISHAVGPRGTDVDAPRTTRYVRGAKQIPMPLSWSRSSR